MYYELFQNVYDDHGIVEEPTVERDVSFMRGASLAEESPVEPLEFVGSFSEERPPNHYHEVTIPVASTELLAVLEGCGVDNLERFDARLVSEDRTAAWEDYAAINVVGLGRCVDVEASEYTVIDPGGDEFPPPLVEFSSITIEAEAVPDPLVFRLVESPNTIIVHEDVVEALQEHRPEGGWGVMVERVEVA